MDSPSSKELSEASATKRQASCEHPEAPPGRRAAVSNPQAPVQSIEEARPAPLPSRKLGPGANPFASDISDLRLASPTIEELSGDISNHGFVRSNSNKENHFAGGSDAATTTSTERWDREDQEERERAAHEMGRRLNLQRAQGHVMTIGMILDVCHKNGNDEKVEAVRVALEKFVDALSQ